MRSFVRSKPEKFRSEKASQAFGLLRAQGGFSLIEALVLTLVLAVMILTIYIGTMFAEKQVLLNYRHRVATLLLSGELEKQYTLYMKEGIMRPYTGRTVTLEETEDLLLEATMSITAGRDSEHYMSKEYDFTYLVGEIRWIDPETEAPHFIKLREDFYDIEGK